MRRPAAVLLLSLLALLASLALPGRSEAAPAPKGFFGVHPLIPNPAEFDEMAAADVGMIRTAFPYQQALPVVDVPPVADLTWLTFDPIVAEAARDDIDLLPVLLGTSAGGAGATPLDSAQAKADWKQYLTRIVARYGPGGSFWDDPLYADVPDHPITDWQIWNEPNSANNWAKPSPKRYGKLLTISARTIHAADPSANVVSAGVISQPVRHRTQDGDKFLKDMLKSKATRKAADVIAIHPYTGTVKDVRRQTELTRKVMDKAKLRRVPIWVTEIGWGSGKSSNPLIVPKSKQRKNLRDSFRMMLKKRRKLNIGKVIWYQWQDAPDVNCGWCGTSGLLTKSGTEKPLRDEFAAIARR
jgi:polysaccharide biosynthesis protein PslG